MWVVLDTSQISIPSPVLSSEPPTCKYNCLLYMPLCSTKINQIRIMISSSALTKSTAVCFYFSWSHSLHLPLLSSITNPLPNVDELVYGLFFHSIHFCTTTSFQAPSSLSWIFGHMLKVSGSFFPWPIDSPLFSQRNHCKAQI